MMDWYKEVGDRILQIRIMRGYTRECLAEMASISPKFLYEVENGKKGFSVNVLYNLCVALNVDSDYILTGNEKLMCDQRLVETLKLFDANQTERLGLILKQIYDLSYRNG